MAQTNLDNLLLEGTFQHLDGEPCEHGATISIVHTKLDLERDSWGGLADPLRGQWEAITGVALASKDQ